MRGAVGAQHHGGRRRGLGYGEGEARGDADHEPPGALAGHPAVQGGHHRGPRDRRRLRAHGLQLLPRPRLQQVLCDHRGARAPGPRDHPGGGQLDLELDGAAAGDGKLCPAGLPVHPRSDVEHELDAVHQLGARVPGWQTDAALSPVPRGVRRRLCEDVEPQADEAPGERVNWLRDCYLLPRQTHAGDDDAGPTFLSRLTA
mmetsp:Transcript_36387/g.113375  ORF Transcript_36387/g.113375 Transcript_36387/m.113375 type:complete len:201 (+) Transcript_36387:287-889(+)